MIILVNDPYDVTESIKDSEHDRRAQFQKYQHGSKNVFIKANDKFPNKKELSIFFRNKTNKIRLQKFLKEEFQRLVKSLDIEIIYSVQKHCYNLNTGERKEEYECHHIEADSIIFFIYYKLRKSGWIEPVIIDAEDTDVIVLAARVAWEIDGLLGIRQKKEVFDCKKFCSEEIAKVLIQLHVQTGADAISAFFGHGKSSVFHTVVKNENARHLLQSKFSHFSYFYCSCLHILLVYFHHESRFFY